MKIIKIIFPIMFFVCSIAIMEGGSLLKNHIKNDENIPTILEEIKDDVENERFNEALKNVDEAKIVYKKVIRIIQFSVEIDELNEFNNTLSLLRGYVIANDKSNAIACLNLLNYLWSHL